MKLDSNDMSILKVLLGDGRASLREIAASTSLSTPTVSLHLSRMQKGGLIKGFVPVLDPGATHQVTTIARLKVRAQLVDKVAANLAKMEEVTGVFLTTGEANVTVRVRAEDVEDLQEFVTKKLAKKPGVELLASDVVTKVVKDRQAVNLRRDTTLKLKCDYCHGDVASDRPYNIRVGSTYHYFCCRTCRRSFLNEHGSQIRRATARLAKEMPYIRKADGLS